MPDDDGYWYEVRQGDWLNSIARDNGVRDPDRIWNDAKNADLAALRDPNVLYPGDWVYIPAAQPRTDACATGSRHTFMAKGVYDRFEVTLQDPNGQPYANQEYRLALGDYEFTGATDGSGTVKHERLILSSGASGVLELPKLYLRYPIQIGALNPMDKATSGEQPVYDDGLSGALMRLRSLGYYDGPIPQGAADAMIDLERHGDPITRFQIFEMNRAPEDATGELDDETRGKLLGESKT